MTEKVYTDNMAPPDKTEKLNETAESEPKLEALAVSSDNVDVTTKERAPAESKPIEAMAVEVVELGQCSSKDFNSESVDCGASRDTTVIKETNGEKGNGTETSKDSENTNMESTDETVTEVIDLMPHSSDDSEDDFEEAYFKKRKISHSRTFRSNRSRPDTSSSSAEDQTAPPPVEPHEIPLSFSSEDEDEMEIRRSRVRARRIVNAQDLVTVEGDREEEEEEEKESSDTDEDGTPSSTFISDRTKEVLGKPISAPRHKIVPDLVARQMGLRMRPSFSARRCASSDLVKRLKLAAKLAGHEGCVNCLSFNQGGNKIASGSDDLNIIVWEWEKGRKMLQFNSGHKANVFQSKFLPGDLLITSCSRDGQVRLAELSVTGNLRSTRKLAQHRGPAHKMTLLPDSPYIVLSAGEDGQVLSMDIREPKPDKILLLRNEKEKKVPIYSIHSSPTNGNLFCTAGREQFSRIFDRRYLGIEARAGGQVSRHCPPDLVGDSVKAYITCAVFSSDGQEVIASYNDEDIYLFNTEDPEGSNYTHRYQGHRNSATVKGVNFYGPRSQFVISGSDCGNIFLWDKETEGIVKLMPGDDNGVVNVLEPHPSLPILATSGLDDEVKLWMPTQVTAGPGHCWQREQKEYMQKTVQRNLHDRETQRNSDPDPLDGQMLWVLWRHIRRAERRRRLAAAARGEEEAVSDADTSEEEDEDESDGEEGPRGRMCTQS